MKAGRIFPGRTCSALPSEQFTHPYTCSRSRSAHRASSVRKGLSPDTRTPDLYRYGDGDNLCILVVIRGNIYTFQTLSPKIHFVAGFTVYDDRWESRFTVSILDSNMGVKAIVCCVLILSSLKSTSMVSCTSLPFLTTPRFCIPISAGN